MKLIIEQKWGWFVCVSEGRHYFVEACVTHEAIEAKGSSTEHVDWLGRPPQHPILDPIITSHVKDDPQKHVELLQGKLGCEVFICCQNEYVN